MKSNSYNALQIVSKVYRHTLKAVPFSGILGVMNYLVQGFFPAVTAFVLAKLFDAANLMVHGQNTMRNLVLYGSLFVATYAVVYILRIVSSITINAGIYERCTSYYNRKISEKTALLPLLSFENSDILNLQSRAKDCAGREILSQIYMSATVFLTNGISVIATVTALAVFNIWFIPISVLSVLPYFVVRVLRGREFYLLKKAQVKKVRRLEYLWKLFHNKQAAKEMRVMGFGDYLFRKWVEIRDEVNEEIWKQDIKDGMSMLFCDALKIIGYGLSILLAFFLTMKGLISIGAFGACIAAFRSMQEAAKAFLVDLGKMPEKIAFANDYFAFLDLPEERNGQQWFCGLKDKISLSNVSFAYPNSSGYALKNISLKINKGEKLVILGVNGSGKTTLVKIILNMYAPTHGEVSYDGINSADINRNEFYSYVSVVQQNFAAYQLTLRENIGISDLRRMFDDAYMKQMLETVGLGELLCRTGSLDTQLGREFGGTELSGGEWQKLAIVRGIFKKSELIVLDEPTSALDPLIETEVLQRFLEITRDKTAVIISHRVGLCKLADRIVLMKNGGICEMGSHGDLMEMDGEYKRLFTEQEQWYG